MIYNDKAEFSGTITNTSTETLEVNSHDASEIAVFIDNGSSGGDPGSYDVTVEYCDDRSGGRYREYLNETGKTTNEQYEHPAYPETYRISVTNQSGSDGTYHVRVIALDDF